MSVHAYLVTGSEDDQLGLWDAMCLVANWVETRGRTHQVMVMDEHSAVFLDAARKLDLTVQEIIGAGESETYELVAGDAANGWKPDA